MTVARPSREIVAYDATRPSPYWTGCLAMGEFAVRYFDPKTNRVVGVDGTPASGHTDRVFIFSSIEAADAYCLAEIERRPAIGCLVHNDSAVIVRRHVHAERVAELARPPSRLSQILKGLLCLIGGGGLIWWDWSRRWTIMIGVLLGIRVVIAGIVYLYRGLRRNRVSSTSVAQSAAEAGQRDNST